LSKKAAKKKQKQAPGKAQPKPQAPAASKKAGPKKPGRRRSSRFANPLGIANIILLLILAAVSAVLIIGPFRRGLFFQHELLPVHLLSFGLFILWWVARFLRRDGSFLRTPLDASIFALVVLYYLSFLFTPASKGGALEEFLKVANYFIIYFMVFDICRQQDLFTLRALKTGAANKTGDPKQASSAEHGKTPFHWKFPERTSPGLFILLHVLVISAAAAALAGIGTAAGTWEVHGAYVDGRIHSPLQYPNTAAAYFTAAYFLALGLAPLQRRWYLRPLYLAPAVVLAIALVFTFSRGAWLLLPPVSLLFLLAIPAGKRLRAFLYLAFTGTATLLVLSPLDAAFRSSEAGVVWPYLFAVVLISVAGGMLVEQFLRLHFKLKLASAGAAAVLLVFLGMQFLLPRLEAPLQLERPLNEEPSNQYLEQRIGNIEPRHSYFLTLDVNATWEIPVGEEEPPYAWRLLVTGYDIEEDSTTLLDHREGPTAGWENRELAFQTESDTVRAEVRLYNRFPGTSVTIRDVTLTENASSRHLTFAVDRLLPRQIYDRLYAIGTGERSVEGRLGFYQTALKIIADYPLLGAGGGGWEALYLGYQEVLYYTSQVHSHFLQVWVETGTLGFIAFMGMWTFFILSFVRVRRSPSISTDHKEIYAAVFIAAIALGAHSALDFNLSLASVSFFLFALLGAGRALGLEPHQGEWGLPRIPGLNLSARPYWAPLLAGLFATVILFFFTLSLWNGYRDALVASRHYQENRVYEAIEFFERSSRRHPYQAATFSALADAYDLLATGEEDEDRALQLRVRALAYSQQAQRLEPHDVRYNNNLGARLIQLGRVEEAIGYIERTLELHPHGDNTYLQVAQGHLTAAEYYRQQDNAPQAEAHLERVFELEDKKLQYHEDIGPLAFYLGEAAYQSRDLEKALGYFQKVDPEEELIQPDLQGQALAYQALILYHLGQDAEAQELEEQLDATARAFFESLLSFDEPLD